MRPFIVTDIEAGKLPRWALVLLCLLYILPGLIGRDPWRTADAAGYGIALTMSRGGIADWLMPNIAGMPMPAHGPLPYWLDAIGATLASSFAPERFAIEHLAVRMTTAGLLFAAFMLFWYGAFHLARRPGVQPSDPFGASAGPVRFARAIADSALLLLMATFGLLVRTHETTGNVAQLAWVAAFVYGCAVGLERPRRGATVVGAAIAATALSLGLGAALVMSAVFVALLLWIPEFSLVRAAMWRRALSLAALGWIWWPLILLVASEATRTHLTGWWAAQLDTLSGPTQTATVYQLRTMPWFFWPAWPVAAWAVWRWRSRWKEAAVALPLLLTAGFVGYAWFAPARNEDLLLPAAVPLAVLAGVGLPTLRRSIVSLIDWFAVTSFTLFGIAIWAYWIALITGYPPRMAYRANRLAPDFDATLVPIELTLGIAATIAWLALVRWRISRRPRAIWRAVALSSGGLVLAWFLLMTLWLPLFNERNTYRGVAAELRHALAEAPEDCIETRDLGAAQRASFFHFAHARFVPASTCGWLLVQVNGPAARTRAPELAGRRLVWQGSRRTDRDERFALYRIAFARAPDARQ